MKIYITIYLAPNLDYKEIYGLVMKFCRDRENVKKRIMQMKNVCCHKQISFFAEIERSVWNRPVSLIGPSNRHTYSRKI